MIVIKLKELLNHFSIYCNRDIDIESIVIDSRKVVPGCLYICLDNKYLELFDFRDDIVVISKDDYLNKTIVIENIDNIYIEMIHYFYGNPTSKVNIIGVTGTNGKTTISHCLYKIVKDSMYIGTLYVAYRDRIIYTDNTTPSLIDILNYINDAIKSGIRYVFMEVSSHSIVQNRVKGIEFDGYVFTNLTQDHLDYHKDMDNYSLAKKMLFDDGKESSFAIINKDDKYASRIIEDYKGKVIWYSYFDISKSKYTKKKSVIVVDGVKLKYKLIGSFNASNVLAIYKVLRNLGFKRRKCARLIKNIEVVTGRMERVSKNVYIDYAHTPDALNKALYELRNICKGKLHVVFGCGGNRDTTKRSIMGKVANNMADYVYICDDNPRDEDSMSIISNICDGIDNRRKLYINPDRYECIEYAISKLNRKDILLVAGKGHEDYMIIKNEKKYFSDRESIKCILNH